MITSGSHIKYANALHKVALKAGSEQKVLHDLEGLLSLYSDPQFAAMLKKITYLERNRLETALKETFKGGLAPVTMNLLVLLGRARMLELLPKVWEAYSHLYHADKKVEEVKICTARKLNPEEEQVYIERLQRNLDKPVSVKFITDVRLIGGVQVYQKGYVTDYSLKNYLETLEKYLLEAGD
jgi:F-type H+-transporting ATPase subunit delta